MQHGICFPSLEMASNGRSALFCRDVALKGDDLGNRLNRGEINTNDEAVGRHRFCCNLTPGAWRGAKIEHDLALFEESILLIQLDQLEGGSGPVPLLLGEFIPFIKTAFTVLLLDRHRVDRFRALAGSDWQLRISSFVAESRLSSPTDNFFGDSYR